MRGSLAYSNVSALRLHSTANWDSELCISEIIMIVCTEHNCSPHIYIVGNNFTDVHNDKKTAPHIALRDLGESAAKRIGWLWVLCVGLSATVAHMDVANATEHCCHSHTNTHSHKAICIHTHRRILWRHAIRFTLTLDRGRRGFWVVLALTECVVFINNPIMYDYTEYANGWPGAHTHTHTRTNSVASTKRTTKVTQQTHSRMPSVSRFMHTYI